MRKILESYLSPLVSTLVNLLLAYVVYFVARMAYLLDNWSYFSDSLTTEVLQGGLVFDTAAILVTNIPYIVLMLLPLHWKETQIWHQLCRWVFVIINGLSLVVNLCDAAYFPYTLRRTTTTVFSEFQNEGNLGGVFLTEALHHWYFVLLGVLVIYALWRLYTTPRLEVSRLSWWRYDLTTLLSLAAVAPFVVAGIRGGFATAVRPITISNANQYVDRPTDAALVLNTPFSLYRTIGKAVFVVPEYYDNQQEMEAVFSPIHVPSDTLPMTKKNVVVLIVESFGREYIGALNWNLENGTYKGYTPHVDSLIAKSITFERSFCNGRKSIDGMPSILSSIPMFVEPFFLTPASMNQVSGIASLLGSKGYQTAFFHGAQRGSMGFMAFARKTGFQAYYGREDFDADARFGSDDDFDGTWAIWDEPFLQYYAMKMTELKEPFITTVFTASSHHPYHVPEQYAAVYPEEGTNPIHKCIRYTDMSLRRFFETARKQPWFSNTIFVFTSDHTNINDHKEYGTDLGLYSAPIFFYDPSGEMPRGRRAGIAQQIDIMPTILGYLGYNKPYVAFGIDLLSTSPEDTWAVTNNNGIYQYVKGDYVIHFDGNRTKAAYNYKKDWLLEHNLISNPALRPTFQSMERTLKAIIQSYMQRMTENNLVVN